MRSDDVAVQDRGFEAGRDLVVQVDQPVGVGIEFLGVRGIRPRRRDPLREQRHDLCAIGIEGGVQRRRDHPVTERHQRRPTGAGILERRLDVLHRRGHLHRTGVMLGEATARVGREVGQLAEREVDLHHAAARLESLDVGDEVLGQLGARNMFEESSFRMQRGDHQRCGDLLTGVEDGTAHLAAADEEPSHPGVGPDLGAEAARRLRNRLGHAAHTALGISPAAELAVAHITDRMVGHHVGGAGFVGSRPRPDHTVDGESSLDLRRFEPVIEQVGDAHGQQPGDVSGGAYRDSALTPRQLRELQQVCGPVRPDGRWHLQEQRPHHIGDTLEPGIPFRPGLRVLLRPLRQLLVGACRVVLVDRQRSTFGECLVVGAHRVHLVAVPLQFQLPHDRRGHQAHDVGQPRHPQMRGVLPGRFRRGRTAE